jgi:hypothetical protein
MTPTLALQSVFHAAERASALWPQIAFEEVHTPEGTGESVALASMTLLFDYFEEYAAQRLPAFALLKRSQIKSSETTCAAPSHSPGANDWKYSNSLPSG